MAEYFDSGLMAGLSAVLFCWFFVCTVGMAILTWRWRDRFYRWRSLGPRDRGDACLNVGLLLLFVHVTQAYFTRLYAFFFNGNDIDEILRISAPFWLPSALLSAAAVSWWVMLEMKIPRRGVWWLAMMAIGASLAATMSRSF
jgi:hypothetical protein